MQGGRAERKGQEVERGNKRKEVEREKDWPRRAESSPQYEWRGRASGRCRYTYTHCTRRHTQATLSPCSSSSSSFSLTVIILSSVSLSPLSAGAEALNSFKASDRCCCLHTSSGPTSPFPIMAFCPFTTTIVKLEFRGFAHVTKQII